MHGVKMQKLKSILALTFLLISVCIFSYGKESISFRISYNANSLNMGDVNTWIESFNESWEDYAALNSGNLQGEFNPLDYKNNFEFSLRIPIYKGFAINGSGGQSSSISEGDITFQSLSGDQRESIYLNNQTQAVMIKLGFSYNFQLPFYPKLNLVTQLGRYIVFNKYTVIENKESYFSSFGREFTYLNDKETSYRSEALGLYASLGLEFELIQYIAFVLEAEKLWAKADGYKGSFSQSILENIDGNITEQKESGKETLYFYETTMTNLTKYYSVLSGHEKRPDDPEIRDLRQGEFDFGGIAIKLGIRFKF